VDGNADEANNIAELAEQRIYSVRQNREIHGMSHIKGILGDVYEKLDELSRNGGRLPGIPTGFLGLDSFLGGLNRSDLILVASRPGMGKTSFALNIALNAAKQSDKDIVIFQLEMSKEQLAERLLSNEALVDLKKLRMGNLSEDDWLKIARASSVLSKKKIYIDDKILNKKGKLTEMEWAELKRHPEIGYQILRSVNEFAPIAEYVLYHHERIDGKGYPRSLKGDEILLQSKIISIADAYDAMTNERSYKDKLCQAEAVQEIKKHIGSQFDENIGEIFIEKVLGYYNE
jgi:hypothetical protein